MIREEAIHFAECLKNNWTINFADMEEFCDMVITVLSADGDLISRADAIEAVDKIINGKAYWEDILGIKEALFALPSADAVSREEYNELLRDKISFANATIPCFTESAEAVPHGRLIDADALIDALMNKISIAQKAGTKFDLAMAYGLIGAVAIIKDSPSADNVSREEYEALKEKWIEAEQRADYYDIDGDDEASGYTLPSAYKQTGEWMPLVEANEFGEAYQSGVQCSNCGLMTNIESDYCPDCGAYMKGGNDA